MFIEAFEYIKENKIKHGDIEILLTCAEEQGLKGIKGFDLSVLMAKYGFVFDSSGSIGKAIIKAPYHSNMTITIKGRHLTLACSRKRHKCHKGSLRDNISNTSG
jgi:tripeptide aminopeptidase